MRIGPLRHRLTIQAATVSQDSYGEPIETWADLTTNPHIWGEVTQTPVGERFLAAAVQVQATVSHKVKVRYRTDITVQMRLVEGSRYLYIENVVDPDGLTRQLLLSCREVQF